MTPSIWATSAVLFASGLAMAALRRELLAILLGLELMINAANLAFVYHAGLFSDAEGLAAGLLVIAVAAAEAVVGLCLILALSRAGRAPESPEVAELRG